MSILTVNGEGVIRGVLSLPRVGAWHADLVVDTADAVAPAVTIEGSGLTFKGTVTRGESYLGTYRARIVGGMDGLRRTARPQHYVRPQFRTVLADLLRAAGETLAASASPEVVGRLLNAWTVLASPIGEQLTALVARAAPDGAAWRLLPDGTVWLGVEAWPAAAVTDWRELDRSPADGSLELGLDGVVLLPGTTLDDHRIDYCEHILESGELRTRAWTVPS